VSGKTSSIGRNGGAPELDESIPAEEPLSVMVAPAIDRPERNAKRRAPD
jgi:hypothetical protein